jgi:hypothetical protein
MRDRVLRRQFVVKAGVVAGTAVAVPAGKEGVAQTRSLGASRIGATASQSFIDTLHSDRPAPDRAEKMGLYGWLIGRWGMEALIHKDDGTTHEGRGEIHFGWVLEGRAIQDVWILPGVFYGTTLRVYDPGIDAWHVLWSDPLRQYYTRQIGRARGNDIVQEGNNDAGEAVRWSFTEITTDSFRWLGERSLDGGATWQLQAEFLARRVAVSSDDSQPRLVMQEEVR